MELAQVLSNSGFTIELFGATRTDVLSLRQRVLRRIKKLVVDFGLMLKTMAGKKLLKRIVFGSLVPLPAEIHDGMADSVPRDPIPPDMPDAVHKIIYCAAALA